MDKLFPEEVAIDDLPPMWMTDAPDRLAMMLVCLNYNWRIIRHETTCGYNYCWAVPIAEAENQLLGVTAVFYSPYCCVMCDTPMMTIWKRDIDE